MNTLYRRYLALDTLNKAFARAALDGTMNLTEASPFPAAPAYHGSAAQGAVFDGWIAGTHEVDQTENLWEYGDSFRGADLIINYSPNPSAPAIRRTQYGTDERGAALQDAREAALFALVNALGGDFIVVRQKGNAYLLGHVFDHRVRIDFGQALCEKVQTGTKMVTRHTAEAQAALVKLSGTLATETVEEPIYEWRCNDAEIANM